MDLSDLKSGVGDLLKVFDEGAGVYGQVADRIKALKHAENDSTSQPVTVSVGTSTATATGFLAWLKTPTGMLVAGGVALLLVVVVIRVGRK